MIERLNAKKNEIMVDLLLAEVADKQQDVEFKTLLIAHLRRKLRSCEDRFRAVDELSHAEWLSSMDWRVTNADTV